MQEKLDLFCLTPEGRPEINVCIKPKFEFDLKKNAEGIRAIQKWNDCHCW